MSKDYLKFDIPLTEEQAERTGDLDLSRGEPILRVHVYYMKDARRRGIKLSINRAVKNSMMFQFCPLSSYNGLLHLADLPRQNDKVGRTWADAVERNIDRIAEIALASERPDWQEIFAALGQNGAVVAA